MIFVYDNLFMICFENKWAWTRSVELSNKSTPLMYNLQRYRTCVYVHIVYTMLRFSTVVPYDSEKICLRNIFCSADCLFFVERRQKTALKSYANSPPLTLYHKAVPIWSISMVKRSSMPAE